MSATGRTTMEKKPSMNSFTNGYLRALIAAGRLRS